MGGEIQHSVYISKDRWINLSYTSHYLGVSHFILLPIRWTLYDYPIGLDGADGIFTVILIDTFETNPGGPFEKTIHFYSLLEKT